MSNTDKNIFLSGFSLGFITCLILGICLLCFTGCSDNIAPRYKGTTKSGEVIEINPNTMKTWFTPKDKIVGYSVKIDSIAYDGYDSTGTKLTKAFVTAFRGKKPIATVFGNMAYYKP